MPKEFDAHCDIIIDDYGTLGVTIIRHTLNYQTITVVYGEKFSKVAVTIIILVSYINVINLIVNFDLGLILYFYYLCLFILAYVLLILWKSRTKKDYLIIHNIMRALILLGIFSIVLIKPNLF